MISAPAMKRLIQYTWPGNIRELDNVIQRALVMMSGDTIQAQNVMLDDGYDSLHSLMNPEQIDDEEQKETQSVGGHQNTDENKEFKPLELPMDLKARETEMILETLRQNSGHRQKTAEALNISPRTLRYKIAKLKEQGVDVP